MDNQQLEHLLHKIDDLVSSHSKMSSAMQGLTSNARKDSSGGGTGNYADNFEKMAKSVSKAQGAVDSFGTSVLGATGNILSVMTGDLKNLQGGIQSTIRGFGTLLGVGGVGGVMATAFGGITDLAGSMVTNFQTLSDSGKTFSGGLMDMATAAFESGKTISEYTEYMHKNSLVAAAMADGKNGGLGALASKVRNAGIQFGEFGYSISELDSLTAQYAERRRATGSMEQLDNLSVHNRVIDLARDTTALSKAFGVSRDQLTQDTTNAIKGNPFLVGSSNKGIETLMTGIMASGPMGASLAKLAAAGQEFGKLSDEYRDLVSTGPVGQRVGDMTIQSSVKAERDPKNAYMESIKLNNAINDLSKNEAEMHNLKMLAINKNKAAADLLTYIGQTHHIDEAKARLEHDHSERIDELTRVLESAGVSWSNTIASFSLGATTGFKTLFDNFKDPKYKEAVANLMGPGGPITKFGERFGVWAGEFFNQDRIDRVTAWINGLFDPASIKKANEFIEGIFNGQALTDAENWIRDQLIAIFGPDKVAMVTNAMVSLGQIGGAADKVSNAFTFLKDNIWLISAAIVGGLAMLKGALGGAAWVAGKAGSAAATGLGLGGKAAVEGGSAVATGVSGAAKTLGKRAIPGLGDALLGWENYQENGDILRALAVGAGSIGGRILGGAAGSLAGPVGTVAGEIGGSLAGYYAVDSLYGPSKTKPKADGAQATPTVNLDHPATATLLGNLSQTTQDALSPAMSAMADSLSSTTEMTNDKQTDALLRQLDSIRKVVVVQTEVMAAILNDLTGTVKLGNDSLDTIKKRPN